MVSEQNREVLQQILGLTDTACQASLELLERYAGGELESALALLSDLRGVIQAVSAAQDPLVPELEYAYTSEMLENIVDTLDEIGRSIQGGNPERAAMKMEFQLFPFLRQLKEAFYFWGTVYPDKAGMERYYREEFAEHYRNLYVLDEEPSPIRLSIVVTGYNHLEMTKKCVEQLLKETDFDALNAELILIDHGSTDGTLEYFENLGVGKVIHFKRNVRMYMFCILSQLCQGPYFCFISNDILVTRDWAKILLCCLESDSKIVAAVPATPNIANLQMLNAPTNDPNEFIAWANGQNCSDPSRWSDRARLMPPLGMYRTHAVSEIGFADPYFYTMEFWDDDFSLRARRFGYRQIVCGDVACYHFGSVTGGVSQAQEGTLTHGRELFKKKHGMDAWGNGFCYDYYGVQLMRQLLPSQGDATLLALDCGMGDTPLQIRNELWQRYQGCQIYQLTSQEEYLPDLKPFSQEALFAPRLSASAGQAFPGVRFSCAYLSRDIGMYEEYDRLLECVSNRLENGGFLVFSCANPFYALTLHSLFNLSVPEGRCVLTDVERLCQMAQTYYSQVQIFPINQPADGLEQFAERHFGNTKQLSQIIQRLRVGKYYFVCRK